MHVMNKGNENVEAKEGVLHVLNPGHEGGKAKEGVLTFCMF